MPTKLEIKSNCPKFKKGKCSLGAYSEDYCGEILCCDCVMVQNCEDDEC